MPPTSRPASLALQCFIALLVVQMVRPPVAWASSPPEVLTELTLAAASPRIAVVVVSQDLRASQQQGALEGAAEAALERASRFTVIPVHDAFNPNAAKKQDAALEESREKMKSGKQALDDLDNVKATEDFTKAVEALQKSDLSRNFPALLEAWTMKAAGHATGGENGPAKKDIESVVGLSPKAEFTPTFFPPDLIKFAEAQRKFAANAKGELLVRTEPPGARVWVDGQYRGVSPVTVAGVTGTKHFIAASEGGFALGQSQAGPGEEVISLAAAEIGPGWKKATNEIKKDPEGSTRDSAAQTLGKAAQLEQVLLVVSKKSVVGEQLDLIGVRLDVRDGHNASYNTATVNPGDPEQLATFFDSLTGKDAKRDGRDPVHHFKGGGSSPVKTIAGISLLGVGVVGLASGIVFGVLASIKETEFKGTYQTATFLSSNIEKDGRAFALVADISYIIGLLAAGTGAVLLLTNMGGGSSEEPATAKKGTDDLKRRELDRKAADDRRAADDRAKEDERRRDEERKREEDRKKEGDTRAADDKRRAEEEETRRQQEEARKKEDEEKANKKLSKKERDALEKKKREEEKQAAADEKKRLEEEEREERARKAEEKKNGGKLTKKQKEEEERKKKEEEEKAKADEEARNAEAEAKKKKEDAERKKREEAEKKKKAEDHDDLRNF